MTAPAKIDSPKNERVKALVRLRERRERDKTGTFLIEGSREVERALAGRVKLEHLYLCPPLLRSEGQTLAKDLPPLIAVTELSPAAFHKVSMRQNPDGVLALARMWQRQLATLELAAQPLVVVLDGLEKPGNIGALLRTADGAGIDAVFVTGTGTDLYNPNVVRSSVGSLFSLRVLTVSEEALLSYLRAQNFKLIAASPDANQSYWQEDFRTSSALILGTEHEGLSPFWQRAASTQVSIPMRGNADSLNVATSGAILIYEALRQRYKR